MTVPSIQAPRPTLKAGMVGRAQSIRFAIRGVAIMLHSQKNAWIHAVMTLMVVGLGLRLHLSGPEWSSLTLAIVAVWTAEAMNTALEFLSDATQPDFHPLVEKAKDVAAGAVLISACGSVVVGVAVFAPHL